jgi:hypothetical protein
MGLWLLIIREDIMSLKIKLLSPYFGELPSWMEFYEHPKGFDFLLDQDLEGFCKRVKATLGIDCPITWGSTKVCDYRCTLGLLYAKELEGYDYWGTVDLDMVFGDVKKWFPDSLIKKYDVISNHFNYVSGPFSLYRNTERVNNLFKNCADWKDQMQGGTNGWVEKTFSRELEKSGLKYKYVSYQGDYTDTTSKLVKKDGKLYQYGKEIPLFHFRRRKQWPL